MGQNPGEQGHASLCPVPVESCRWHLISQQWCVAPCTKYCQPRSLLKCWFRIFNGVSLAGMTVRGPTDTAGCAQVPCRKPHCCTAMSRVLGKQARYPKGIEVAYQESFQAKPFFGLCRIGLTQACWVYFLLHPGLVPAGIPSTQTVVSKYSCPQKQTGLFGEMAESRSRARKVQGQLRTQLSNRE